MIIPIYPSFCAFSFRIPRTEVEEIHQTIMHELERSVQSGCISTIAGG